MNLSILMSYLKARDAASANRLSGYAGFIVPIAGAGAAYAIGALDPYIQAFCADPKGYTLQLIIMVALAATAVNSGTTAALTPKQDASEPNIKKPDNTHNTDLEKANSDYPKPHGM